MVTLDREVNPQLLLIYSQLLDRFSADQLAKAYERAEASLEGWPSPASVVKLILERRRGALSSSRLYGGGSPNVM